MKKYSEKLQYITNDESRYSLIEQADLVCNAGAKWIQYRCFNKSDNEMLNDINVISSICDDWGATLIVTDHIHLANQADIQGFHIENMEADFRILRAELGDSFTLGGSSNTVENAIRLAKEGADYIGLGPYSISSTKPNNYPLLGCEGYRRAVEELNKIAFEVPLLAVGGIKLNDVDELMQTGIFGIAVSEAIYNAKSIIDAYIDFYKKID